MGGQEKTEASALAALAAVESDSPSAARSVARTASTSSAARPDSGSPTGQFNEAMLRLRDSMVIATPKVVAAFEDLSTATERLREQARLALAEYAEYQRRIREEHS
jgi:hypothetical protein